MVFIQTHLTPPLIFGFFLLVLLQVFNIKNIITLNLVMCKVFFKIASKLSHNSLKLPQNFWISPEPPPFGGFEAWV